MGPVPVLEIGGTHVTAALVDGATVDVPVRMPLSPQGSREEILDGIVTAASKVEAPAGARWGVAVPGPFDYNAGIGLFHDVGKFESLYGVDVGAELTRRLPEPAVLRFLNDADAFGIGEYVAGAAAGHRRAVCLTLGSGVGSAFLDDGVPVNDGPLVPPEGSAHRVHYRGRPLEETVSRRAIRAAYGHDAPDVQVIAELARDGDPHARTVLANAFHALGVAMGPWLAGFEATVLVVGGSIAASWDLVEGPLQAGLDVTVELRTAQRPVDAPLLGAARWATRPRSGPDR
ncbi:ROK family protein [Kutzneria sp. CA-103260]|uniref:ROK family protein n=1 Tax=Kutzneria sp. CA-103260 TaxID=2802641 RepID=UPI001BAD07AE|nr:ROK family protein [Kutzneria sp. CA-103260]